MKAPEDPALDYGYTDKEKLRRLGKAIRRRREAERKKKAEETKK